MLYEHVMAINNCYPEEVVKYYSPGYSDTLLERIDQYVPAVWFDGFLPSTTHELYIIVFLLFVFVLLYGDYNAVLSIQKTFLLYINVKANS